MTISIHPLKPLKKDLQRHQDMMLSFSRLIKYICDYEYVGDPKSFIDVLEMASSLRIALPPGLRTEARKIIRSLPSGGDLLKMDRQLYTSAMLLKHLY